MGETQPTISTHVLDTGSGRPAEGVEVALLRVAEGEERIVGGGITDADGRIRQLLADTLEEGYYRLEFRVDGPFFMSLAVWFRIDDPGRNYHVPLQMAPFGLGTYLGS